MLAYFTKLQRIIFYIMLFVIACATALYTNNADVDLWARLAIGSLFFQTGGVIKNDIFAFTPTKEIFVDHEWGSGAVFFFLADKFGDIGLILFKVLIFFGIFLFVIKIIELSYKDQNKQLSIGLPYFVFLALTMASRGSLRSQLFTIIFFILWIYVLERIRKGENRLLWILPATMIIWTNVHGGFVAGLGLILIYALGELLNKKNYAKYFAVFGITLLVTLINPYGIKFWYFIIDAITMPRPLIVEWQPFYKLSDFIGSGQYKFPMVILYLTFVGLTLITGIRALIQKTKIDWVKVLLFGILLYISMSHKRHDIFFSLAAASLLYSSYADFFNNIAEKIKNKFGQKVLKYSVIVGSIVVYSFMSIYCVLFIFLLPPKLNISPMTYPIGSVEFIKQNNLKGNLAGTYNWGSYLLWKLYPQCLISLDGRYEEVYPEKTFNAAIKISDNLKTDAPNFLDTYHTDIILLWKNAYSPLDLVKFKGWKGVYEDYVSIVLVPENKARNDYIMPDYRNPVYYHEDLSKHVDLN